MLSKLEVTSLKDDFEKVLYEFTTKININIKNRAYYTVKKLLRSFLRQIIIRSCIEKGLDPRVGIYHRSHKLGMVADISFALDAELDLIAIDFFQLKQNIFWEKKNWLSNSGVKMLVTLYEKRKSKIQNRLLKLIDDINKIIL